MEYVDGVSLEELLRGGALPAREKALQFLRQIADALDYAHRKGIVHRDIKPANIIVSGRQPGVEQVAKIADFGVATFLSSEVAHSGALIGTPNYMSPEQIQGLTVGGKTDQFSLGVVVYEVLCGAKPFAAQNLQGLLYPICKQNPKPVEQVNPLLNETVGRVMARALAKEPEERFPSCCDFVAALSFALNECPEWQPAAVIAEVRVPAPERLASSSPSSSRVDEKSRLRQWRRRGNWVGRRTARPGKNRAPQRGNPTARTELSRQTIRLDHRSMFCGGCGLHFYCSPEFRAKRAGSGAGSKGWVERASARRYESHAEREHSGARRSHAAARTDRATAGSGILPRRRRVAPAAKPQPEPPPLQKEIEPKRDMTPSMADVELVTDPPAGKVVVDGRQSCLSPCSIPLSSGRHTLTAELAGYTWRKGLFKCPTM